MTAAFERLERRAAQYPRIESAKDMSPLDPLIFRIIMTTKYEALDAEILACIAAGKNTLTLILAGETRESARKVSPNMAPDRVVDARLQAMRKRGVIKFQFGAREWVMA